MVIDYSSNQSNHFKTYESLVNMGISGDCIRVRFSHPLLLKEPESLDFKGFSGFLFCAEKTKGIN